MMEGDFIVGSKAYIEELRQKGLVIEEVKDRYVLIDPKGLSANSKGRFIEDIYVIKEVKNAGVLL